MDIQDLKSEFNRWRDRLERPRPDLMVETNLLARAEALDFFAFAKEVIRMQRPVTAEATLLQADIEAMTATLTAFNQALFDRVRSKIQAQTRARRGNGLRIYLDQFTDYGTSAYDGVYTSYDGLDLLIDGIFALREAPAPTRIPDIEMVHCEETPARVILDLIDHVGWQPDDVFYDLGSGVGQVVILVHLLTRIDARGVEYEPAYAAFATAQATALNLTSVTFINADARIADYDDGTIFFLFTPFRGEMLRTVLAQLRTVAQAHPIRVCTFGSCTPRVAEQSWLRSIYSDAQHEHQLVIFESV